MFVGLLINGREWHYPLGRLFISMNGVNWRDFVDSIREAGTYRNRIKTLDKDMSDFLDKGPQKKGSPYKTKRTNFSKKKFNDISAPPGAAGGLEEEVAVSYTHLTLPTNREV